MTSSEHTPATGAAYLDGFTDGAIFFASSAESFRQRRDVMNKIRAKVYAAQDARAALAKAEGRE